MGKKSKSRAYLELLIEKMLFNLRSDFLLDSQIELKQDKLRFHYEDISLDQFKNIYVIGSGKCSPWMARSMESVLGDRITDGAVISNIQEEFGLKRIRMLPGSHPLATPQTLDSTKKLIDIARVAGKNDLVIYLLSGGTSSMLELLHDSITLAEFTQLVKAKMASGADIYELNKLRSSYSLVKSGGLAQMIAPATCLTIVLSDVPNDSPAYIGSGPTSNPNGDPLKNLWWQVGNNATAKNILREIVSAKKYRIRVDMEPYNDSVEQIAERIVKEVSASAAKTCLVFGGESFVPGIQTQETKTVGGRNQHLALNIARRLRNCQKNVTIACIGTDGIDGNSNAAGAIIETDFLRNAPNNVWQDLESSATNFDSATFWQSHGYQILTGLTGTNVMDIVICLIEE